jgi:hypothetical protein
MRSQLKFVATNVGYPSLVNFVQSTIMPLKISSFYTQTCVQSFNIFNQSSTDINFADIILCGHTSLTSEQRKQHLYGQVALMGSISNRPVFLQGFAFQNSYLTEIYSGRKKNISYFIPVCTQPSVLRAIMG